MYLRIIFFLAVFSYDTASVASGEVCDTVFSAAKMGSTVENRSNKLWIHYRLPAKIAERIRSIVPQVEISYSGMTPRGREDDSALIMWLRDLLPVPETGGPIPKYVSYANPLSARGRPVPAVSSINSRQVKKLSLVFEGGNGLWIPGYFFSCELVVNQNRLLSSGTFDGFVKQMMIETKSSRIVAEAWVRELFEYLVESKLPIAKQEQSSADIRKKLSEATDVPVENVVIFPWLPGEKTGHIDMWLRALSGNTLVMPYIPEYLIKTLGYDHEKKFANRINRWLDQRFAEISKFEGIQVKRLPMLPPKNLQANAVSEYGFDAQYFSSVNLATYQDIALVPEHEYWMSQLDPRVRELIRQEIRDVLQTAGFKTEFVDAAEILDHCGGLHCATYEYVE